MNIKQFALVIGMLGSIAPSHGALLKLSDTPLFSGSSAIPNIFFTLDDSGSMTYETMIPGYWQDCAYDPLASGTSIKLSNCGFYETYDRIFFQYHGATVSTLSMDYYLDLIRTCDQTPNLCPVGRKDWRALSHDFNKMAYDPSQSYSVWYGVCSDTDTPCSNANFFAAKKKPYGLSDTKSLSGFSYIVWIDNKGFSGERPYQGNLLNVTDTPNGIIDLWDSHIKVTINSNNAAVYAVNYSPFYINFNNQGIGETISLKATLTDTNACYNVLGSSDLVKKISSGEYTYTSTDAPGCATIAKLQQNYANWYQYHRSRFLSAQYAIGAILELQPYYRYGLAVINQPEKLFATMPKKDDLISLQTHNATIQKRLNKYSPAGPTPLRIGVDMVGSYFQGKYNATKGNPIAYACQQNFNIILTDGAWTDDAEKLGNKNIGDEDGDGISRTLADIAYYYYKTDLSNLPNVVSPNAKSAATHQNLVTFALSFGLSGLLKDTDGDGWPNPPLTKNDIWGANPFENDIAKIDDLWHAAFNSKGAYLAAKSPQELYHALASNLTNIAERMGSASSAAQNSTVLNENSKVYQARFNNTLWYGELIAYPIAKDGTLATLPTWNAHCILSGGKCAHSDDPTEKPPVDHDQRVIITKDWQTLTGGGIPFRWPENDYIKNIKDSVLKSLMKFAPYPYGTIKSTEIAENQSYGEALINYLRGDTTYDGKSFLNKLPFRKRYGLIGDIVNSAPIYIDKPNRIYPDNLMPTSYEAFKSTYANRMPLVGFGANDGMYHLLNADNGEEVLAYVPQENHLWDNLANLADTNYSHRFYVDGFSRSADVYFNGAWHTILVSGLRQGGQGIFALDITNPFTFSEDNAKNILLWEFTDLDDSDLGYTYSDFQIGLVNHQGTKRWAVIFGNGYNNTDPDGANSTTGKAVLYILFIDGGLDGTWTLGKDYLKFPVGEENKISPNGLASPYPVDLNQDYVIDYVYAGDLNGVIWKFNLTNSDPSTWAGSAFFEAKYNISGDQSITTMPIVGPHPNGIKQGVLVYFGTGKFLEFSDNTAQNAITQTFYSILDKLDGTKPTKDKLLKQSITHELKQSYDTDKDEENDFTYELRISTDNEIDWSKHQGWYLNLEFEDNNRGERVIYAPILRKGHIIFATMMPAESACSYGGESWLMELNAFSGARLEDQPFDLNKNKEIEDQDLVNLIDPVSNTTTQTTTSGMKSSVGITATPTVFNMEDSKRETKVISGSNGLDSFIENGQHVQDGRKTWRQLQ